MKKYQLDLNKIASYRKKGMDQMIENYIKSFSTLYDLKSYIVYDVKNFPKKNRKKMKVSILRNGFK